jgi:signal transduction histidine kinase
LPVQLEVSERRYELPPGLDLAAFRVVQEALTNVLKHAGPTHTSVRLDYGESTLMVDVADNGRTSPAPAATIPAGTGRGLIGLQERISLYGGELDAGPRPGGGWRVRARFPVDPVPVTPDPVTADPVTTTPVTNAPAGEAAAGHPSLVADLG